MAENKQQDTNKLLQVRRDKLAELQAAGKDPFEITKYDVTNHSEDVKETYTSQGVFRRSEEIEKRCTVQREIPVRIKS